MTEMYLDFCIRSEKINFDFSDLITCGEIHKNNIGDLDERRHTIIPYCNWCCITTKKNGHYIDSDDLLRDFYKQIRSNLEQIKNRIRKLDLEVCMCIVVERECEDDSYSLNVSKEMVQLLNNLNASLDFDLYIDL